MKSNNDPIIGALVLAGLASISIGAFMVALPLGFCVTGSSLVLLGVLVAMNSKPSASEETKQGAPDL